MRIRELPRPILITKNGALRRLVGELGEERVIAVDTESNSLYAYFERVCLIQFSTLKADYLVDTLALDDLSPLGAIFRSPKIEKVFHAAEYDLLTMKRDFGFEFDNLFDTMVAARILGWEAVGLGSILELEFGVRVNKRFQRANWGRRPLPEEMLDYARLDTHYLIALRDQLLDELERRNLLALAREDFRRLNHVNGSLVENSDGQAIDIWRMRGATELTPRQAAVLYELCRYRDGVARRIDRPLFKVIGDKTLVAIASEMPEGEQGLSEIEGMSKKQMRRHADGLLEAVKVGMKSPPLSPQRKGRPDYRYLNRLDRLKRWRKQAAREMGVESDVVMPRDLLYELAAKDPRTEGELRVILAEVPWRLDRFGDQIIHILRG